MPRVSPQIASQLPGDATQDQRRTAIQQTDQNNAGPQVQIYPKRGGGLQLPRGAKRGDQASRPTPRGIAVRVWADKGTHKETKIPDGLEETQDEVNALVPIVEQYKGIQTGTAAPTTAAFPNSGDWGWFINTTPTPDDVYFVINNGGSILIMSINPLGGSITAAQHGSLTDNSTAKHANATANPGGVAGFMSANDKTELDAATASATASTLVLRDSSADVTARAIHAETAGGGGGGFMDADQEYRVAGTRVLLARQPAIADATGASLANTTNRLNDVLAMLRTHGIIYT